MFAGTHGTAAGFAVSETCGACAHNGAARHSAMLEIGGKCHKRCNGQSRKCVLEIGDGAATVEEELLNIKCQGWYATDVHFWEMEENGASEGRGVRIDTKESSKSESGIKGSG